MLDTVHIVRDGAVAIVTLNRPDRRNALDRMLERDLIATLEQVATDDHIRAVVLTGAGPTFCAGADLTTMDDARDEEYARRHIIEVYGRITELLLTMPKPVLAAVNGIAAGAGCSIALACDLRVMTDESGFVLAFSNIGLVPDAGSTWLLARQVGYSRAFELAAGGRRITADRCYELGLVNKVVSHGELMEAAIAWAKRLAARPTQTLAFTKQALQAALTTTLKEALALEADLQVRCLQSEDFREGVAAFLQKREPVFRGR